MINSEMVGLGLLWSGFAPLSEKRELLPRQGFSFNTGQTKSRFLPAEPAFQAAQAPAPLALTSVDNNHLLGCGLSQRLPKYYCDSNQKQEWA